jgi:hypothetical protein
MLTRMRPRKGKSQALDRRYPCVAAASVMLAVTSIVISIEMPIATPGREGAAAVQGVNRTLKGDFRPIAHRFHQTVVKQPVEIEILWTSDQALLEGCESLASSLTHSRLGKIAGRCLS